MISLDAFLHLMLHKVTLGDAKMHLRDGHILSARTHPRRKSRREMCRQIWDGGTHRVMVEKQGAWNAESRNVKRGTRKVEEGTWNEEENEGRKLENQVYQHDDGREEGSISSGKMRGVIENARMHRRCDDASEEKTHPQKKEKKGEISILTP